MKSYSSKQVFCAAAAFGLALAAAFTACSNDITEVTKSTGIDIIAMGETLPACDVKNEGDTVFVADSSAVYYCARQGW